MRECVCVYVCVCVHSFAQSCLTLFWPHGLQHTRLLCVRDFPGKNAGEDCHPHLQGLPSLGTTHISCVSCIDSRTIYHWATWRELAAPLKGKNFKVKMTRVLIWAPALPTRIWNNCVKPRRQRIAHNSDVRWWWWWWLWPAVAQPFR